MSTRELLFWVFSSFGAGIGTAAVYAPWPKISLREPPVATTTCERSTFPAEVLRTVDGDTIEVMVDLGLDTYRRTKVRLVGIDTPEVFGPKKNRDPVRGPAATKFTKAWVAAQGGMVELVVHGNDKYGGRIDADVYPAGGGQRLSDALLAAGHAK